MEKMKNTIKQMEIKIEREEINPYPNHGVSKTPPCACAPS
jgi:hypothetical protein